MSSNTDLLLHHISTNLRYCGLCALLLREHEDSIVGIHQQKWHYSSPFQIGRDSCIKLGSIPFSLCAKGPQRCYKCRETFTVCFHSLCFDLLECDVLNFPETPAHIHESIQCMFEPTPHIQRKRFQSRLHRGIQYLQLLPAKDRFIDLLNTLPNEIISKIAQTVNECSFASFAIAQHVKRGLRDAQNSLEDGLRSFQLGNDLYILSSNIITPPSSALNIIYTVDDIAVQSIEYLLPETRKKMQYSTDRWYKNLPVPRSCGNSRSVLLQEKGYLVKEIHSGKQNDTPYWNTNLPPLIQHKHTYIHGKGKDKPTVLFSATQRLVHRPLSYNLSGLSVSCRNGGSWTVHTHEGIFFSSVPYKDVEHNLGKNPGEAPIWIYFQFNKNEKIANVWIQSRIHQSQNIQRSILMIRTTEGRVQAFGPYIEPDYRDKLELISLNGPDDGLITGLTYDSHGISSGGFGAKFAIDCDRNCETQPKDFSTPLPSTVPTHVHGSLGAPNNTWYLSTLPKGDVESIQVCTSNMFDYCPCLGLLIQMEDSTTYTLGQWRFDQKISQVFKRPAFLKYKKHFIEWRQSIFEYICEVHCCIGTEKNSHEFTYIPVTQGILWWFGNYGTKIVIPN